MSFLFMNTRKLIDWLIAYIAEVSRK